jgi:uncharacterized repeat protein (TIGR01451 family)
MRSRGKLLAAVLAVCALAAPVSGLAKHHRHHHHKKKRIPVATGIVLSETPAMSGVVIGAHGCRARRYVEIRRFGNDALVGTATSNADGTFRSEDTYSGPAYAYTQPAPRHRRYRCNYGLSAPGSVGLADLGITQAEAATGTGTAGYDFTLTNAGPDTAQHVVVGAEPVPAGGTFGLDTAASTPGCKLAAGAVTCEVFSLRPGQTTTVHVVLTCDPPTTGFMDTATVSSSARDPNTMDNESGPLLSTCS